MADKKMLTEDEKIKKIIDSAEEMQLAALIVKKTTG